MDVVYLLPVAALAAGLAVLLCDCSRRPPRPRVPAGSRPGCWTRVAGDTTLCERCGARFDTGDPDPPACRREDAT